MSRLYEALRKMEEDKPTKIEKDDPPHQLGASDPTEEKTISLSPLFLVETLRDIKKTVGSIYKMGLLSMEKADNNEDREHSRMAMTKAYDQIISTVDMLSSYINATSPIVKKNTIHFILEDILESNERKLHAQKIEVKTSLAEKLPETIFHDEQVRFILNLVLQYAILSTPAGGSIEIVTRFVDHQKEEDLPIADSLRSQYSEILISVSRAKHSLDDSQGAPEVPQIQREGTSDFILRLVREMTLRNQGTVDFKIDQGKIGTRISLRFAVERRRANYYRPITL